MSSRKYPLRGYVLVPPEGLLTHTSLWHQPGRRAEFGAIFGTGGTTLRDVPDEQTDVEFEIVF